MSKKTVKSAYTNPLPTFKTIELMSMVCGIGENRLRQLMDNGELEYLPVGNRRLLADEAVWNYYQQHKVSRKSV